MKTQRAQGAHRIVCSVIGLILLVALAYATTHDTLPATAGAALAVALGLAALCIARLRERWRAVGLASLGMMAVGVLIHAQQGRPEAHFAVFVFLAFLPVYRDWLPIIAAALTVCLHHLLFNQLQQWSWGAICFVEPSLAKVLEHAGYVALAALGLVVLSRRARIEMRDLQALNAMQRRALYRIRATTERLALSSHSIARSPGDAPSVDDAVAAPATASHGRRADRANGRWANSQLALATAYLEAVATQREQTMHRYTEQLRLARDEAIAASHAKSAFLANMSHEIRTPLTSIIGFAELLLQPRSGSVDARTSLQTIVRNGRHLLEVINDILDLAKIETQQVDLEQVDLALPTLLRDLTALVAGRAQERDLAFAVVSHWPLPARINTDPVRLKQILLNFCSNAIKFTARGSVTLELSYRPERPALVFAVTDTGIGMSREQIERLFQPFVQADVSTTRKFGGTGLGLYISHQLATQLGGRIVVHSQPGHGSRFELDLSLPAAVPAAGLQWFESELADGRHAESRIMSMSAPELRGHVLLAEDGRDNQRLISAYLEQAGLSVGLAANGQQAVEAALSQDFDIVLMDMQMPVMDGLAATRTLRAAGYRQPIIALTANVMKDDVQRYRDAGCDDVLGKPLDRQRFYDEIARHLQLARQLPGADVDFERELADLKADFEDGLAAQADAIEDALRAQDWPALARLAHVLKGTAGSFGHGQLSTWAATVETEARAGQGARATMAGEALLLALAAYRQPRIAAALP